MPPFQISALFGISTKNGISIEPYLRNVWITEVSEEQYRRLIDYSKLKKLKK
jgi:hypothetical protein